MIFIYSSNIQYVGCLRSLFFTAFYNFFVFPGPVYGYSSTVPGPAR